MLIPGKFWVLIDRHCHINGIESF